VLKQLPQCTWQTKLSATKEIKTVPMPELIKPAYLSEANEVRAAVGVVHGRATVVRVHLPLVPRLVAAGEAPHSYGNGLVARRVQRLPEWEVQGEPRKHPIAEVWRAGKDRNPHVAVQARLEIPHQA